MKEKWQCLECGKINESDDTQRHKMDICECGKTGVDMEKDYCRIMGNIKWIK
jgi:hypothetical protein